jgi:hypothetical protein
MSPTEDWPEWHPEIRTIVLNRDTLYILKSISSMKFEKTLMSLLIWSWFTFHELTFLIVHAPSLITLNESCTFKDIFAANHYAFKHDVLAWLPGSSLSWRWWSPWPGCDRPGNRPADRPRTKQPETNTNFNLQPIVVGFRNNCHFFSHKFLEHTQKKSHNPVSFRRFSCCFEIW